MELSPKISLDSNKPVYVQLYEYIKEEILERRIVAKERMPSIRRLSEHIGVSKTTVESTYQQLMAEGFIYSVPQKGYYVSDINFPFNNSKYSNDNVNVDERAEIFEFDFKREYVEQANFDLKVWKKHYNNIFNYNYESLYTYGHAKGELVLRNAIAKYVHRSRGVNAKASEIIVGAGVQPLLNILSHLVKMIGIYDVAIEDPGFNRAKSAFLQHQLSLHVIPTQEIDVVENMPKDVRLCYVSPSHQFPTGHVMRMDARSRLISWANEADGYIIEDDYNSELRYEGKPIPALQGMDANGRVIYLGSFSTVLIPAIRISFMVLPKVLLELYEQTQNEFTQTASKIEQLVLAQMMESGDFEKHIRKIRKIYAKKSEAIIQWVNTYLSEYVEVIGVNPGLNVLLKLKKDMSEDILLKRLHSESINVSFISEFTVQKNIQEKPTIVLGFKGIDSKRIEEGIKRIKKVFEV